MDEAQIHVEISTFFGMRLNFKSTQNFLGGCYDNVIYIKKLPLDGGMTLVKNHDHTIRRSKVIALDQKKAL